MQLSILLSVLYFAAGVVSQENRNLRIAYEMMWLWNNYQLDLTKPEADRTIGYRCVNWLAATSECDAGVYQACAGSITEAGKEGTCSLREFLAHICNQPAWRTQVVIPGRNTAAIQNNLTPDIESTVENLYSSNQRYTRRHYKPQNTIKYSTGSYNGMIDTIADHTRERLNNMTPEELDANSVFFANQADSLDGARQKRIFDHNRVVLPIIEGKLAASGITLAYNDFGTDIGNQAQKVFNIDKTIAASPDVDPEDVRNALQKALDEEYDPDRYYTVDGSPSTKAAIDHKNVISSFTQALNKSQGLSCTSE